MGSKLNKIITFDDDKSQDNTLSFKSHKFFHKITSISNGILPPQPEGVSDYIVNGMISLMNCNLTLHVTGGVPGRQSCCKVMIFPSSEITCLVISTALLGINFEIEGFLSIELTSWPDAPPCSLCQTKNSRPSSRAIWISVEWVPYIQVWAIPRFSENYQLFWLKE